MTGTQTGYGGPISKGLFLSKTFWGVMIALAGSLLGWSEGFQLVLTDEVAAFAEIASQGVGAALALYGRLKANVPIDGLKGRV